MGKSKVLFRGVEFAFFLAAIAVPALAPARVFYVDPALGAAGNDGSAAKPWRTLKEVFDGKLIESRQYAAKPYQAGGALAARNPGAPVKAGDTLMLRSGYHDTLFASEYYNADYITIMAQPGHAPRLGWINLRSVSKWVLKGLQVSPEFMPAYARRTLVNIESHNFSGPSRDCIIDSVSGFSVQNAAGWSKDQWNTLACNAVNLSGPLMVARRCHFRNVNYGISASGDSSLVEYSTVENFTGDGLRGLGNYGVFQYNVVKNSYEVNDDHRDGFQSWSVGPGGVGTGEVVGMVLRGNTILNYEDANQPFRGALQGLGNFDGIFRDWLVENNVVATDHWHGITLLGAVNCRVINNTVVDLNAVSPGPPWIQVGAHKDGRLPTGCLVRNNLTTDLASAAGVAEDHNIVVTNYQDFFRDPARFDFRLKAGSAAIDAGTADGAPSRDREGLPRPQGNAVDIGAYEFAPGGAIFGLRPAGPVRPGAGKYFDLTGRRRGLPSQSLLIFMGNENTGLVYPAFDLRAGPQ